MADVLAVTVTYGDRVDLCLQTLRAVLRAGAAGALVVANGLDDGVLRRLRDEVAGLPVQVVALSENTGSAGGFGAGIRAALKTDYDLVWLLDDDNVADERALEVLREEAGRLGGDAALLSYRPDDALQSRLLAGARVDAVYGPPGSFLYFDLLTRRGRHEYQAVSGTSTPVPYGPYGGLLVPRQVLARTSGPIDQFHLYEDDTEFTLRLARQVGLRLVHGSVVRDCDSKWSTDPDGASGPTRLLMASDTRRRFFGVRNRVVVDLMRVRRDGGHARLLLNVLVYLAAMLAAAARMGRPREFLAVVGAMRRGAALERSLSRSAEQPLESQLSEAA